MTIRASVRSNRRPRKERPTRRTPGVVDVLLLQLGTPTAPTAAALRPYLRQFLSDARVIEGPAWLRWLLVNGIIVPFRSPKSAAKYRRIWDPVTGSPLMHITQRQTAALGESLGSDFRVHFAMRYGEPSVASVVNQMMEQGCERLVVLPMYPQYSATTTASGLDALFAALQQQRIIPDLRVISDYHDDPMYIDVCARRVEEVWQQARAQGQEPEVILISFHGIPIDYVLRGDPYQKQATVTGKLLAQRLGLTKGQWRLVFQSRLGRQKWLLPYTDETLMELGRAGVKRVLVTQPGFTADCLETIDEIGYEGLHEFQSTGGETLIRVPCLNDYPPFIAFMHRLVTQQAGGWM